MPSADNTLSLIIPVYGNEANIPGLLKALEMLAESMPRAFEVVFVVDGSPDRSYELLRESLGQCSYPSQLLLLSRNFGSFSAIRAGLAVGRGCLFAVMAADLQEPPELVLALRSALIADECDVAVGSRITRADPWLSKAAATVFWAFYRRFIQPQMPRGGVDIFACNDAFRHRLLALTEGNSSLIGLIIWLGHRRKVIGYERRQRFAGKSAWTFRRKFRYLLDSIYSFSDLPLTLLTFGGAIGMIVSLLFGALIVAAKLLGYIPVPGYAAIICAVMFFGGLNSVGLGILGGYLWRTFENTKRRPSYVILQQTSFFAREPLSGDRG